MSGAPHRPRIRRETSADRAAVAAILTEAFGGRDEAALMARLRVDPAFVTALVAEDAPSDEDETRPVPVIGVIAFGRVAVQGESTEGPPDVAALGPLAVQPSRQNGGVGSALTQVGLAQCRKHGIDAVLALGFPRFFSRFGFTSEAASTLSAPWSGPDFQARTLRDGVGVLAGRAVYPAAYFPEPAAPGR